MCRIKYRHRYSSSDPWMEFNFDNGGILGSKDHLYGRPSDRLIAECLGLTGYYEKGLFIVDYFEWTEHERFR